METHTAGSASGLRKRSDGNIGTAPQADRTARARSPTPVLPTAATTSTATHVRDVDIWRVEVRDDVRDVVPDVDVWDVDVRLVGVDVRDIDVREVDVGDVGEVGVNGGSVACAGSRVAHRIPIARIVLNKDVLCMICSFFQRSETSKADART